MVKRVLSITALGRSGVSDFFLQRLSALILLAYFIFLLIFYFSHPVIDFMLWHNLFAYFSMRIFSLFALGALLSHAWIGIWIVLTDYLKSAFWRGLVQTSIILLLLSCFVWGAKIFWS